MMNLNTNAGAGFWRIWRPVIIVLLASQCVSAQVVVSLQGTVVDSQSRPVPNATVSISNNEENKGSVQTDTQGRYSFRSLNAGTYVITAEKLGVGKAQANISVAKSNLPNDVELRLISNASAGLPQFSDDASFNVAGVTDASSAGSHGSSATAPSSEALAKATVALGHGGSDHSGTLPDERSLKEAADHQPSSFEANREAGVTLARNGKTSEAENYLQRASKLEASKDRQSEVHHALGAVLESLNKPLDAVLEYQKAAELDPSETNLFDWGSELLLHRAIAPAIEVFSKAHTLYPQSSRTLLGLAAAFYSQGSYREAAQRVCEASDLSPSDPNPYLFMGEMIRVQAIKSAAISDRLARFAKLQPENATANYLYALSLWQQRAAAESSAVKRLIENAIRLEPKNAEAYLLMGIVNAETGQIPDAISAYESAIRLAPQAPQAHYRLALAYERTGEKSKADKELQLYKETSQEAALEQDRQRRSVQQFVFSLKDRPTPAHP